MAEDDETVSRGADPRLPPAARPRSAGRLRARGDRHDVEVLRMWRTGFSVAAADAGRVGGRVDLYDGARFLCRALVVASDDHEGERRFDFKYATHAGSPPPRPDDMPVEDAAAPDDGPDAVRGIDLPAMPSQG